MKYDIIFGDQPSVKSLLLWKAFLFEFGVHPVVSILLFLKDKIMLANSSSICYSLLYSSLLVGCCLRLNFFIFFFF